MQKEEKTNSVLEAIIRSDKYINSREISEQTNIAEEEVLFAISIIRNYNQLFLDFQEVVLNQKVVFVRVREYIRDDVRKFLDNGGFISIQKELSKQQEFQQMKEEKSAIENRQKAFKEEAFKQRKKKENS